MVSYTSYCKGTDDSILIFLGTCEETKVIILTHVILRKKNNSYKKSQNISIRLERVKSK